MLMYRVIGSSRVTAHMLSSRILRVHKQFVYMYYTSTRISHHHTIHILSWGGRGVSYRFHRKQVSRTLKLMYMSDIWHNWHKSTNISSYIRTYIQCEFRTHSRILIYIQYIRLLYSMTYRYVTYLVVHYLYNLYNLNYIYYATEALLVV